MKRIIISSIAIAISIGGFFVSYKYFTDKGRHEQVITKTARAITDEKTEELSGSKSIGDTPQSPSQEIPSEIENVEEKDDAVPAEKKYFISPQGSDSNDGLSASSPFRTIQKAIDLARAGETVELLDGTYLQDIVSKTDGSSEKPITIRGGRKAILKGGGNRRIIEINHDFITLIGFTIDGLYGASGSKNGYRDKLVYILGKKPRDGVNGLKILDMSIKNAGGECMRLRYFSKNNEIAGNTISNCGVVDFKFKGGGKNGEGIYIGTAPEQLRDGKNPTADPDQSSNNWIHDNNINTQGNECVDIKEASSGNIVENNRCTGQKDPESGGMDSRGSGNIFRKNEIFGCLGVGIRLGGDKIKDGTDNLVYSNTIRDSKAGGLKIMRSPQAKICGNAIKDCNGGVCVGEYAKKFTPAAACV